MCNLIIAATTKITVVVKISIKWKKVSDSTINYLVESIVKSQNSNSALKKPNNCQDSKISSSKSLRSDSKGNATVSGKSCVKPNCEKIASTNSSMKCLAQVKNNNQTELSHSHSKNFTFMDNLDKSSNIQSKILK